MKEKFSGSKSVSNNYRYQSFFLGGSLSHGIRKGSVGRPTNAWLPPANTMHASPCLFKPLITRLKPLITSAQAPQNFGSIPQTSPLVDSWTSYLVFTSILCSCGLFY